MRKQRESIMTAEKIRRDNWMQEKSKEIKELTVKGLQPEIERLIAKHKNEVLVLTRTDIIPAAECALCLCHAIGQGEAPSHDVGAVIQSTLMHSHRAHVTPTDKKRGSHSNRLIAMTTSTLDAPPLGIPR